VRGRSPLISKEGKEGKGAAPMGDPATTKGEKKREGEGGKVRKRPPNSMKCPGGKKGGTFLLTWNFPWGGGEGRGSHTSDKGPARGGKKRGPRLRLTFGKGEGNRGK